MTSYRILFIALLWAAPALPAVAQDRLSWNTTLLERVNEFGHRNWIAIVDSAYPMQTSAGVETIVVTGSDHLFVVRTVMNDLSRARHVRPVVYVDAELNYVAEDDAPGIEEFRAGLAELAPDNVVTRLPHAEIIDRLNAAGEKFRVLVLKTPLRLPYTSVFIELDCDYWTPAAEERLRAAMDAAQ
jgi:hypothetical protein